MNRDELAAYLDDYLRVGEIQDKSLNGLQVEGPVEVTKIAVAVDACQASFELAVSFEAQMLIVHHGLFWGHPIPLVGPHFRRVKTLFDGACGLYASHLPLDLHPEVGNSSELARMLDLSNPHPFGEEDGSHVGIAGTLDQPLEIAVLIGRLIEALQTTPVRVLAHGPDKASLVGCITGDAADFAPQVQAAGLDTFVTGETSHAYFHAAAELGLNVIFAGHYATETLGLKALARHIENRFEIETVFLDVPTGM